MKKLIIILTLSFCFSSIISCGIEDDINSEVETTSTSGTTTTTERECGTHNGKTLWTGPQGGCYYYNSNNNKTYVDRSECSC